MSFWEKVQGISIVEIVQVSFAGIAFLLAFLAYSLLRDEGKQPQPRVPQLQSINRYMAFAFAMGLLSIGAQFFSSVWNPPSPDELELSVRANQAKIEEIERRDLSVGLAQVGHKDGQRMDLRRSVSVNNTCPNGSVLVGGRTQGDPDIDVAGWQNLICAELTVQWEED